MKAKVILSERHALMPKHQQILNRRFGEGNWEILFISEGGLKFNEMTRLVAQFLGSEINVVFVSPILYFLRELAWMEGPVYPDCIYILRPDHTVMQEFIDIDGSRRSIHNISEIAWKLP